MFLNFIMVLWIAVLCGFQICLIVLVLPIMFLLDVFNILPNWLLKWYCKTINEIIVGLILIGR